MATNAHGKGSSAGVLEKFEEVMRGFEAFLIHQHCMSNVTLNIVLSAYSCRTNRQLINTIINIAVSL